MGFVLIGIYSGSQLALQGAVIQMLAHGVSAAALFILSGQLYERLHTRDMREMGGVWSRIAYLPAISLFFAAASLGLPGTGNFVGEFLILIGSFASFPWVTAIATTGLVFGSVYSLIMIHRAYFGPSKSDAVLRRHGCTRTDHGARSGGIAGLHRRVPATVPRYLCCDHAWRAAVDRHRLHSTRFGPVRALWNSRSNTLSRLRRC